MNELGLSGVDTVFVILSTVLVMIMTPGLALFYGGMVRRKNVLSTTMHSYVAIAIVSLQWILVGYSLAFGKDIMGIIGNMQFLGLHGVSFSPNVDYAASIPHQSFMLFQMMFAIITPALISGAFAERIKFSAFLLFILLWITFVYDPIAHWVWANGGWIRKLGALDFAGGNVVHISSGVAGLIAALIIGKRTDKKTAPHHVPMTILGAGILWFGWFGFNSGSALAINDIAMNAFLTTNTSAAASGISWICCEWIFKKKPSAMGFASGAVSGLVAITPGAGFISPMWSIVVGLIGGCICFFASNSLKEKLGYDDALDAFSCHGIGGTWGGIATGLFSSKALNPAGADGLIYGNINLLGIQIISILAVYIFVGVMTFGILKTVDVLVGLRVDENSEKIGLDVSVHGELAYREFNSDDYVETQIG